MSEVFGVVHIAGPAITIGTHLRQRCSWCGAVILDVPLDRTMVTLLPGETEPGPYPTWPIGELIEIDGGMTSVIEHSDGADLPPNACGCLDPEMTR